MIDRELAGEAATAALGAELALFARPGMWLLLEGDLGAGKSTLARALIRALGPEAGEFEVPSPTFTLVQAYDFTRIPVAHADLYRIRNEEEIEELGLGDLSKTHLIVVEWAERMPVAPAADWLRVTLEVTGSSRSARLQAHGGCLAMLQRMRAARQFLRHSPWQGAERRFLQGDASYRRYERLLLQDGRHALLMDMPDRPAEPPLRDGRGYSAIARRAKGIAAVIGINRELRRAGYSAPDILHADLASGLAIIEDFGDTIYGSLHASGADADEPMRAAVDLLADMAGRDWPQSVPVAPGVVHQVPPYDLDALLIEIETLPDWFWPLMKQAPMPGDLRAEYLALWTSALERLNDHRAHWVLRDVHSPNLIWLPAREGLRRVGLIDTQDCVRGHPAYDLASLLQDARVTIDPELADRLFEHYCTRRGPSFDRLAFEAAFALLGAQRATKILGIFARLALREGKPGYLQHIPRVSTYLERNLQRPNMSSIAGWFARNLPHDVRLSRSCP